MFNQTFYFSTLRKYVTLFGTLFNNIFIIRTDAQGNETAYIRVPITYGPKEKMLARLNADPNIDRQIATLPLPMMAFEMTDIQYDPNRKLNTVNKLVRKDDTNPDILKYQYNPVAYNIGFRLYVYVKNAEDGTKIVEQILPYFTPDWTTTVKLIPEMDIKMDIPVILQKVSQEDSYDGSFDKRRALIWTFDFVLKGYIYGPVKTSKIIKYTNTVFYVASGDIKNAVGNTNPSMYITVQPGLTANGEPTSNAALSIPVDEIEADDDFGYVTEVVDLST